MLTHDARVDFAPNPADAHHARFLAGAGCFHSSLLGVAGIGPDGRRTDAGRTPDGRRADAGADAGRTPPKVGFRLWVKKAPFLRGRVRGGPPKDAPGPPKAALRTLLP